MRHILLHLLCQLLLQMVQWPDDFFLPAISIKTQTAQRHCHPGTGSGTIGILKIKITRKQDENNHSDATKNKKLLPEKIL
jgi:hypothetical protein